MPTAREAKKAETRARLMRETARRVLSHGTEDTTVADVATTVGVSARTFHNYFASLDAALEEFLRAQARAFNTELKKAPAGASLLDTVEKIVLDSFHENSVDAIDNVVSVFRICTALETIQGVRESARFMPTLDTREASIALYGLLAIAWAAVDAYQHLPEPRDPSDGEQLIREAFATARNLGPIRLP